MNEPTDYDGAWKETLEHFLPQFLALTFPAVAAAVDWSAEFRFLDTELQELAWNAEVGRVRADKLVEVHRYDGESELLLIHIEIQSQRDDTLPERMFRYYYRLFDRFDRPFTSLAVLADPHPSWKPTTYSRQQPGSRLHFEFGMCKLHELDLDPWLAAGHPVATVIAAHRLAQRTSGADGTRRIGKLALVRQLRESGLSKTDLHAVFNLINWLLALPAPEELLFRQGLHDLTGSTNMRHITNYDRVVREEGLKQGRQESLRDFVRNQLLQRFGTLPEGLPDKLPQIHDEAELSRLVQFACTVSSLEDFRAHFKS